MGYNDGVLAENTHPFKDPLLRMNTMPCLDCQKSKAWAVACPYLSGMIHWGREILSMISQQLGAVRRPRIRRNVE
jgi:hypothetical protein